MAKQPDSEFRDMVYAMVSQIPEGQFMTYGQLAALCGHPRAAHVVGTIAHFGPSELPWHRVVNRHGSLASGFPGGKAGHRSVLADEGVEVSDDFIVNIKELIWWPNEQ